jgi:hypothetical membrane protein
MTITGLLILGVALLVVGWLLGIWIIWVIGAVVAVAALILLLVGMFSRGTPAGRRPL